jgi:undecaprenyl diphosphate synthase
MTKRGVPKHVAIITDGNGRWARARNVSVAAGHRAGAENVRARLYDAIEIGIRELTVYAFSTENWSRSGVEVRGLIALLSEYIDRVTPELHRDGVRLRFIGDRGGSVPADLVERMEWAEQLTAENAGITFTVPFNYGGRAEICQAAVGFTGTTEEEFTARLYAPSMHDPDLLIRTGGDQRLSNYLLWQAADSELVFRKELWPTSRAEASKSRCRNSAVAGDLTQTTAIPRRPSHPSGPASRRCREASLRRAGQATASAIGPKEWESPLSR